MIRPGPRVAAALLTLALLTFASNDLGAETFVQVGSSLPVSLQLFGELSQTRMAQPKTLVLLGAGLIGVFWLTWLRRRS